MISLPNVSKMLAICCLVLATPFPSLASDRDGRVTEALETVQEIAEFSSPGSMPTPLVRRCFVAVDRLLRLSPEGSEGEVLRTIAGKLEPRCQRGPASQLERLGLLYLLAEADFDFETDLLSPTDAAPLQSSGQRDGLRVAVRECWNVGALSTDALGVTVTVAAPMQPDGRPDAASIRLTDAEGGSGAAAERAFDAARRAIIRCGQDGYDLPADEYDQWRDVELIFAPDSMQVHLADEAN